MSKLIYVLSTNSISPVPVGGNILQPGVTSTFTVEADSADDNAISSAVALGFVSVVSVAPASPAYSFERRNELTYIVQTVPYAATITPDVSLGGILNVGALTGAVTMNAPINPVFIGQSIDFMLTQDATGSRVITWNAIFKKSADGAGASSQAASKSFKWNGTNWVQQGGALVWL